MGLLGDIIRSQQHSFDRAQMSLQRMADRERAKITAQQARIDAQKPVPKRGKPRKNEKNEWVVDVYDERSGRTLFQENLGKAKGTEEKLIPLFNTITKHTQMFPESEASRLQTAAPSLYRTKEQQSELEETPTQKRVWDKEENTHVYLSNAEIAKDPKRYGQTLETIMELKRAGAAQVNVGNILGKARAKDQAFVRGIDAIPSVIKRVKDNIGRSKWEYMPKDDRNKLVEKELDDMIRSAHPKPGRVKKGIKIVNGKEVAGWWDTNDGTLIQEWKKQ
ncbi:MAG: hypothetical protein GY774_35795 [Planctomycetes bacterium]|nr:hypothetical protein [Planctomycetota bacterium]